MVKNFICFVFFLMVFSGCQVSNSQEPSTSDLNNKTRPVIVETQASEAETPTPSNESDDMSELETHPNVFKAKDNLATLNNISFDQIEVVLVRSMTWPDSSLGCPQPDMAYTQVQKEGMLIQLRADGFIYNYHSGENSDPFLCIQRNSSKDPAIKLDPSMARTPLPDDLDK